LYDLINKFITTHEYVAVSQSTIVVRCKMVFQVQDPQYMWELNFIICMIDQY